MDKKTVRDLDVAGKKVLVRVDFNVPLKVRLPMIPASPHLCRPFNICWSKRLPLF